MTAPVPRGCNGRVLIDRTTTPPPRATKPRTRTGPGALPRRAVWVVGWLAAAAWALSFPLASTLATHRAWGLSAAAGYAGAALAAWWLPRPRARALSLASALAGAVVVPLTLFVLTGHGQSEVGVIERSGVLLVHRASPYLTDPQNVGEYTPYLPGMALFGLPRALFGDATLPLRVLGDARLWCAGVFLVCLRAGFTCLAARLETARARASYRTGLAALLASPVVALPLCVSGVDLPLAGLCCLGLTLAARARPVAAGLALAAACALKWTAWPAVAVAAALLTHRAGRRAAVRCAATTVAGAVAAALPSALLTPGPMVRQVLAFPTGRGDIPTPAASPLPGRLLADLGPLGWYAAVALLLCGGAAVATTLVLRPPATAVAAADRLAAGLCTAFLLAPAGRFGYLALPVVLVVWPRLAAGGGRRA
ncbi:glycosyltransferase 87 family protein [Streptomyces sp. NPDC053474]|uniref:glycosyltransferase 87 family protein n=1 Tax=Streptomyces sp. NPDC053474 TaxID=3365704 RepID=UPI0037D526F7